MVLGIAAAGVATSAAGAGGLFGYNRRNFLYDRKMRQETEYQIMDFRIEQAKLWREDVKDIIGLTSVKMDTYLVVNAVQLGFCVLAFCEGRLPHGCPTWLVGCHTISLAGAFMFLLMSLWLAMQASVTAKSYEVRFLTQHVRLPVPSWSQVEGARTYASSYEKIKGSQMFRVPFLQGSQEAVMRRGHPTQSASSSSTDNSNQQASQGNAVDIESGSPDTVQSTDVWGLERRGDSIYEMDKSIRTDPDKLRHLRLLNDNRHYWQAYDGFARVSMSMGTHHLIVALSYYVLGYVLISNHAVIAAWLTVFLFMAVIVTLISLDMSLTASEFRAAVIFVALGPCACAVATQQWALHTSGGRVLVAVLMPIVYLSHSMWLVYFLYLCKVTKQKGDLLLPTAFRSVMYVDVFGWIRRRHYQLQTTTMARQSSSASVIESNVPPQVPGSGPAIQSVRYDEGGFPVATGPELEPGAEKSMPDPDRLHEEHFEPTSFIPRQKKTDTEDQDFVLRNNTVGVKPGWMPWRVFCAATLLLTIVWLFTGTYVLFQVLGWEGIRMRVKPHELASKHATYEASVHGTHESRGTGEFFQMLPSLAGGHAMNTSWPGGNVHPQSLSCSGMSLPMMFAASRYGIYSAKLSEKGSDASSIYFEDVDGCEGIDGESLQDVSVDCDSSPAACTLFVLHRQGQQLSMCSFTHNKKMLLQQSNSKSFAKSMSLTSTIAASWLADGNFVEERSQEEVKSFVYAGQCQNDDGQCAYVETSRNRIAEVQKNSENQESGEAGWFPTRMVHQDDLASSTAVKGNTIHPITPDLLGVLQPNKMIFQAIEVETGEPVGQWQLPELPNSEKWTSLCSVGNHLYFLSQGHGPQIWQFPLPAELRSTDNSVKEHFTRYTVEHNAT